MNKKWNSLAKFLIAFVSGGSMTALINQSMQIDNLVLICNVINSWPSVLSVLAICTTIVISILIVQIFTTIRERRIIHELQKENEKLKNSIHNYEKKVNELEDQKRKYQIELIRLNEKMAYWIRKREAKEKMNSGAMRFVKKGRKNE